VVDLLKKKQSGQTLPKTVARATARQEGNVIELLKRSHELSQKSPKKTKAPSVVPAMPKSKKKQRA
jgi:hypothetical protein